MEALWSVFCENIECSGDSCHPYYSRLIHPYSCVNHAMNICFDILLLFVFLLFLIQKKPLVPPNKPPQFARLSGLQILSAIFNVVLGLVSLSLGSWIIIKNIRADKSLLPLHWWLLAVFHGLTCLILGLTISLKGRNFPKTKIRLLSILSFVFATVALILSLYASLVMDELSIKVAMDVFSFLGAGLLLLCTYKVFNNEQTNKALYEPLNSKNVIGSGRSEPIVAVTPYATANILSKMSFWWLNAMMKLGKEKTLEDKDMPKIREEDGAQACYLQFMENLSNKKQVDPSSQSSILKTLVVCHWKEILVSGIFALVKIITVSSGPLLLKAFIKVAEGNKSFENEGYVLAISLFFAKTVESLAERQWFFRSRLVGLKVRSFLTAAIYKKQFRLSNAAKMTHSAGEITNYVTVDAYRIGEFPFWCHQTWTTLLQLCFALLILYNAVGLATIASMLVIVLTVAVNAPLAKLLHKYQTKLMVAQDARLKASSEALANMKVLKLYAWETHFRKAIEKMREVECKWLKAVNLRRAYNSIIFWASPVLVSVVTFATCHLLGIPLYASNVFTFVATLRLVQDPVRSIPDVIGVVIQAQVSYARVLKFLEAPELDSSNIREKCGEMKTHTILIKAADFSWEENLSKPTLRNINLEVRPGEKVAICGEVGSGKSTLLAAVLGEVPNIRGNIQVCGSMAYVSQSAWIQTGTIRENVLFGSELNEERYQEVLEKCSLLKDLELLPHGDLTEIGQKGVNLSGGQKQRIQLARALYQNADIYLLDDPFSAVDAQTASSLLNEYVMGALATKTVLLVTHQVDFLPAFDAVLLMSDGEILHNGPYYQLLDSSKEFQDLVNAHKETAGTERLPEISSSHKHHSPINEIKVAPIDIKTKATVGDQLIKLEEREVGDSGFKPYIQYMRQNKAYLFFTFASFSQLIFVTLQILQNSWMAANVDNPDVSSLRLIMVYLIIGLSSTVFLLIRSLSAVSLGMRSSRSLFSQLLNSLFRAPVSFYDSTPLGRILSRVSTDLNIIDLDVGFSFTFAVGATMSTYSNLVVLAVITWQVLIVSIPMVILALQLQRYYYASAKELMRINGTTKSFVANHLAESIAGSMTIRAFKEEDRFFLKNLELIDVNSSPFFLNFVAKEWLILRLETLSALVLGSSALCMVLLPPGTFTSGFIGMALSYGLSLNTSLVKSIQNQCTVANYIISVERLCQYTDIPSEAPEIIEETRPPSNWPSLGKVEIQNLQVRYRPGAPLVIRGISCTFEGGHKIGIVGRTGSGKTTLTGCLFRLVEPTAGRIIVDGIDISTLGLHDLRSRFGIIPQDPTLFNGTVRYNLDPLSQHTDQEIWEVLVKCQLGDTVREKDAGLDSMVMDDGSNWSMGQRQLFCLGRALLRRSKLLVLDEATASIDNATDMILQKTIRTEFSDCTVITVAHRIPTVMDCTKVLAISDGVLIEYDEPMNLMKREDSLFRQLVEEYWSHLESAESH